MKYVIISDIHGNLEAFTAVSEDLSKMRDKEIFCAGDIVGYGADPEECARMARRLGAVCVMGNHDAAAVEMTDITCFNEYAKAAVLWTRDVLSDSAKDQLRALPYTTGNEHFTVVHGTLHEPEEFIYMMTGADAMHTFEVLKRQVCFVGHSMCQASSWQGATSCPTPRRRRSTWKKAQGIS